MDAVMNENATCCRENQSLREKYGEIENIMKETGVRITGP